MATIVTDLISHLQCGESISANDAIYVNNADGKIYKFDVTNPTQVFAGIAKEAGVLDDFIRVAQSGRVKGFSGLTVGNFVYASTTTPGGFQTTEPAAAQKVVLGIAKSATELIINGGLGIKPGGEGGGAGSLDVYYSQDFEALTETTDFTTGNNATFLGGGSIAGSLTLEESTPISGNKSLKYTQAAGSLNDFFASPEVTVGSKQQNNTSGETLYYEYDGNDDDGYLVIYDETNNQILNTGLIKSTSKSQRASIQYFVPSNCVSVRWGYQVLVENSGAILLVDDVELSTNPFVTKEFEQKQTFEFAGLGSSMTSSTAGDLRWGSLTPTGSSILTYDDANGRFTAQVDCEVDISSGLNSASTSIFTIDRSGSVVIADEGSAGEYGNPSTSVSLSKDQYLVINSSQNLDNASNQYLTIEASKAVESVIAYNSRNAENLVVEGAGNGGTSITANVTDIDFTEVTDTGFGGNNWNGTTFTVPEDGIYTFMGSIEFTALSTARIQVYKNTTLHSTVSGDVSKSTKPFSTTLSLSKGDTISLRSDAGATLNNSTTRHTISITKIGVGDLLGVPKPLIGYVKDVKTSGTDGGTSTSNTVHVRSLNTTEGDFSKFGSLSSNQFTLEPGVYHIEAVAPTYRPTRTQVFLYNVTDSSYDVDGTSRYSETGVNSITVSELKGEISITTAKTFEIRHWVQTGSSGNGLGIGADNHASNPQSNEVFTQVKITKLA